MEAVEGKFQKSYFDVLGVCCSTEIPLLEKVLNSLNGIKDFSIIVPTRTLIVIHDPLLLSQDQIVKALNQARLEANIRVLGNENFKNKWPSPYSVASGMLLVLSFLKYVYSPLKWLAVASVVVGIPPILLKAVAAVRNLYLDINILALIAVAGSIALRDYWEAGTIVFLFTISSWLESRASHKAAAVMSSLVGLVPQKATLAETGEEVNADEVKLNTALAVKAGEVIPIDGIVVEGNCEVDEKILTGESFPVTKQKDSTVLAGTINLNGYISIKTTAVAEDCVVARMAKIVEEAQSKKSRTQRFIDKCARYYTPAIVAISALLAIVPLAFHVHNKKHWYHLALVVLVNGCPCALILSTPVAMFCALSKAATFGILFKGAEHLETLAGIKVMAFDKTGTITRGEFLMVDFKSLQDKISLSALLYWIASIEFKSSHPMAAALVDFARAHAIEPTPDRVENFQNFPGEGIYGKIDDNELYIGNWKIASRAGCSEVPKLEGYKIEGKSVGYVFLGSSPAAIFCLSDACRTGAKEAIHELKSMGIKTVMLTGDCDEAARHAQEQLGGALEVIRAELLPEDKATAIKELQKEGPTAMIGDGLNDAPALAIADIGMSMGVSGSALATESGDVVLLTNDILRIPKTFRIAKNVRQKLIQNVILSVSVKAAILAIAVAGYPLVWAAVLSDVGTCLLVIFNSMLLLKGTPKEGEKCYQTQKKFELQLDSPEKYVSQYGSSGTCSRTCGSDKCSSSAKVDLDLESQSSNKPGCCGSSSGTCGSKKFSSSMKEHGHNEQSHPHSKNTCKGHQCCDKADLDLGSQRSHNHGRSDDTRCCEKNSCAKSINSRNCCPAEDSINMSEYYDNAKCCEKNSCAKSVDRRNCCPPEDSVNMSEYYENAKCCEKNSCAKSVDRRNCCAAKDSVNVAKCCEKNCPAKDSVNVAECCEKSSCAKSVDRRNCCPAEDSVNVAGCKIAEGNEVCVAFKKRHPGCCDDGLQRECCIRGGDLSEIVIA